MLDGRFLVLVEGQIVVLEVFFDMILEYQDYRLSLIGCSSTKITMGSDYSGDDARMSIKTITSFTFIQYHTRVSTLW
jgi:hypothetical protein